MGQKPGDRDAKPAGGGAPEELERLRQDAAQAKEQQLRLLADVENTRKRLQREKDEFARFAGESLIRAILPILDSLEQALAAVDRKSDADAVVKGVHLIHRQLHAVLEKEGVKRIPTVGERFDPHVHEAVAQVDAPESAEAETVVEEVQAGYLMHGKLIRPAMVKVATSTAERSAEDRSGLRAEGSGEAPRAPSPEPRAE